MLSRNITLTLILFISSLNVSFAMDTGFDEICTIYTEVKNSNMTKEVASKYILDNIKSRVKSAAALQTHEAIMSALGNVRYDIFKESAELTLKKSWSCPSMKSLMH